ncbi:MAG: hypothetical protein AAGJ94_05665 [Pseudomonadota bacterium]
MNINFIVQRGRLEREAAILATSLVTVGKVAPANIRAFFPVQTDKWPGEVTPTRKCREFLEGLGVTLVPFDNKAYGGAYPHANRIYAMAALGGDDLMMDTDMVALGPVRLPDATLALGKPMRRPRVGPGSGPDAQWDIAYAACDLGDAVNQVAEIGEDAEPVKRPYYNAGMIYAQDAASFGALWLDCLARVYTVRDQLGGLLKQKKWSLDQISLPIAIQRSGTPVTALPMKIYNNVDNAQDTLLWHYHFVYALFSPWTDEIEPRLGPVLNNEDLLDHLKEDEIFQFWRSPEGRIAYRDAVGREPATGKSRRVLRQKGYKFR